MNIRDIRVFILYGFYKLFCFGPWFMDLSKNKKKSLALMHHVGKKNRASFTNKRGILQVNYIFHLNNALIFMLVHIY